MLPKIIFRHSWIYEKTLAPLRSKDFVLPKEAVVLSQIKKLDKAWSKIEGTILREIAKITKLKWQQKEIICYINPGIKPFSDPLTLPISPNTKRLISLLVHELIHRILSEEENHKKLKKSWQSLFKKYKTEDYVTRVHIVVQAVYIHVFYKFFSIKDLQQEISLTKGQAYIKAWKIINDLGYDKIIKEFFV